VWTFKAHSRLQHAKRAILKIIKRNKPDILLLEKPCFIQQKSSKKFKALFNSFKKTAQEKKLAIHELSPKTVRKTLYPDTRATRLKVAQSIVSQYSYLKRYLPRNIPILFLSQREKYWLRMFDAVALGIVWLKTKS
jgi:Holliday junction resolvasome RuvABC endonuclease subunit